MATARRLSADKDGISPLHKGLAGLEWLLVALPSVDLVACASVAVNRH
jgi:hypothetical protein